MQKVQLGTATLYQGDCMDLMATLADNAFELAVVDPPYGIDVNKMNMGGRKTVKPTNKLWDKNIPKQEYFDELNRCSKNMVIWGGQLFQFTSKPIFCHLGQGRDYVRS